MPGVLAVLTGAELAADKIGNLICGWMIHSKDGTPMKMAPHPALANGKACHVGDAVAVVVAETLSQARDAAEKVKVDYDGAAGGCRSRRRAAARRAANPRGRAKQHDLSMASRRRQGVDAAFKSAKHVTKLDIVNNRLVPNAIEPRAAIGDYDFGTGTFTLWNTTQNPHVARLVICRLRRHGARAQASRHRARRRRRLRLEDLHLSRGGRGAVGARNASAGR